jgi:glutathione S-transferase
MVSMIDSGLTLYELAGADPELRFSPHCWKVLMALAHKGLEATRLPLRFCDKDTIAFSGQPLFPVIRHGTETVSDSWRIALYLEDRFPSQPSLFGDPHAVSVTRFVNSWADAALVPAIARIILLDIYECLAAEDRSYFRASREKIFGMPLEAVIADQPARLEEFRKALRPLRHLLKNQEFVTRALKTTVERPCANAVSPAARAETRHRYSILISLSCVELLHCHLGHHTTNNSAEMRGRAGLRFDL